MSLFVRPLVNSDSLPYKAAAGEGTLMMLRATPVAADANAVLTAAQISSGLVQFTGFTVGRNITTPAAAAILAACAGMDNGDSFSIIISIVPGFAGTWIAGAGVTLAGRATTPAASFSIVVITKLSATTVEWRVL